MMGIFEFDGEYLNHYMFFTNRFSLFSVLIIAILIITALVIIYISVVSINSMKYDLGVLLSMGIGKDKMILTVLSENGIFMFVSIIFGYLLAVVLSFFTLVYYDGQLLEVMGKLNLTVDIPVETFLFTVGGSLFFTVIPMLIQSVYILRFSPYTILQNK
jgi:ABC-type antimicrobial peptide transport system permease subunit